MDADAQEAGLDGPRELEQGLVRQDIAAFLQTYKQLSSLYIAR